MMSLGKFCQYLNFLADNKNIQFAVLKLKFIIVLRLVNFYLCLQVFFIFTKSV